MCVVTTQKCFRRANLAKNLPANNDLLFPAGEKLAAIFSLSLGPDREHSSIGTFEIA
jgi:hypothetical protein